MGGGLKTTLLCVIKIRSNYLDTQPKFLSNKFTCPHCGSIAKQDWRDYKTLTSVANKIYSHAFYDYRKNIQDYQQNAIENFLNHVNKNLESMLQIVIPQELSYAECQSCEKITLWINRVMVYPKNISIETPNSDLNEDIKELYVEAAGILSDSPKGATALLRLALQKLLVQIGKDGININNDIKVLVAEGLSPKVQKSLDLLRVVGNNAVHPGQISFDDNSDIAIKLFKVLNIIADEMISRPKEIENLYDDIIPEETKGHIEKRDKK